MISQSCEVYAHPMRLEELSLPADVWLFRDPQAAVRVSGIVFEEVYEAALLIAAKERFPLEDGAFEQVLSREDAAMLYGAAAMLD